MFQYLYFDNKIEYNHRLIYYSIYTIVIFQIIQSSLTQKNYTEQEKYDLSYNYTMSENLIINYVGQLGFVVALTFSLLALYYAIRNRSFSAPSNPGLILSAYSCVYLLSSFYNSGQLKANFLIFPILYFLVGTSPLNNKVLDNISRIILVYVYSTIVLIIANSNNAIEANYEGLFGLTYRLHGTAQHANNLAWLCAIYVCLYITHKKFFGRKIINLAIMTIFLLFCQSKTIIIALLAACVVHVFIKLDLKAKLMSVFFILSGLLAAVNYLSLNKIYALLGDAVGDDLATLTGRTPIWDFILNSSSLGILGLGSKLWDYSMRMDFYQLYGWQPLHSHNQFIQSYAELGCLGIALLLVIIIFGLICSNRSRVRKSSLSLMLWNILIIKCISEVPFRFSLNDSTFILVLITLISSNISKNNMENL